ncbi:MAG TPA: aminopeptidase P family protein [Streptosporangiaceae bacterium]|jgi:Xaa-Pro aminopeptidase
MAEIHAARRARARAKVIEKQADAALITSLPNVRYLTGLVSSNAALLLPADGPEVLATDSRYAQAAARDCPELELVCERFIEPALIKAAIGRGLRSVAFEAQQMTVERHQELLALDGGLALFPFGRAVESLRVVKDEAEIALLARACEITSDAFSQMLAAIAPGVTEREFAIGLERAMTDGGAEALAFDTIVASGPNGAIPHHRPGTRAFEPGDLITIDCGARYAGYHADMTRTVALGEPAGWQREIYDLVAAAQRAGVGAARHGVDVSVVDAAARDLIEAAGYGGNFQHGVGHGVGLEVHEDPMIGYTGTGTLADRTPITVEPGIYLPGKGGVRIEDTLVVRSGDEMTGAADLLTTTTRELLVR